MCLNHVGGWFSKTERNKKFDPRCSIKFLEPPWPKLGLFKSGPFKSLFLDPLSVVMLDDLETDSDLEDISDCSNQVQVSSSLP